MAPNENRLSANSCLRLEVFEKNPSILKSLGRKKGVNDSFSIIPESLADMSLLRDYQKIKRSIMSEKHQKLSFIVDQNPVG